MSKYPYIKEFDTWKNEFNFYIDIKIRFSETDMFGHMNNVSSFIYFEEARIAYMKKMGIFSLSENQTTVPVVADLQCDYQAQVFFDDKIKLYVKADSIGTSSMDLHYMAVNEKDKLCFTGRGRMVNMNVETGKPVPMTDEVKNKLTEKEEVK